MSMFLFADDMDAIGRPSDILVRVPEGIVSTDQFLDSMATLLKFPSYFGGNWNAFEDCLCDLTWLPEGRLVLAHSNLPNLPDGDLKTYIEILRDAVIRGNKIEPRDYVVVFPSASAPTVTRLLKK